MTKRTGSRYNRKELSLTRWSTSQQHRMGPGPESVVNQEGDRQKGTEYEDVHGPHSQYNKIYYDDLVCKTLELPIFVVSK